MNRDLTVNLRINTSTENAKAVSDTVAAVTSATRAGTTASNAYTQAQQSATVASAAAAQSAQKVGQAIASQGQQVAAASSSLRSYSGSVSKLDEGFAELEEGLKALHAEFDRQDEARRRLTAADQKMLSGVKETMNGITSLARSVVLLVAANEDQATSMLKIIATFESVAQAVKGVISIVSGATKAWQAYTAAAAAAAVASRFTFSGAGGQAGKAGVSVAGQVLGGVSAGVAGGAVAGLGGQVLGGVSAGGAGGAAAGAAGTFGTYALGATGLATAALHAGPIRLTAPLIVGSMVGFGAYQGASRLFGVGESEGFVNQGFGTAQRFESLPYLFFSTWRARSSEQASRARVNEMLSQQQIRARQRLSNDAFSVREYENQSALFSQDMSFEMLRAGIGLEGGRRGVATSERGLAMIQERRQQIGAIGETESLSMQAQKRTELRQLLEQENNLEIQRNESRVQAAQEEIRTAKERLSIAQQESEVAKQRLDMTRTSLSSMNRGEQNQLVQAVGIARQGGYLSDRQRGLIRRAGLRGFDDAIQSSEEQDIGSNPQLRAIFEMQRELNKPIEAKVKAESELVIKLEQDLERQKPIWQAELMAFLERQAKAMTEALKAEREMMMRAIEERIRLNDQAKGP